MHAFEGIHHSEAITTNNWRCEGLRRAAHEVYVMQGTTVKSQELQRNKLIIMNKRFYQSGRGRGCKNDRRNGMGIAESDCTHLFGAWRIPSDCIIYPNIDMYQYPHILISRHAVHGQSTMRVILKHGYGVMLAKWGNEEQINTTDCTPLSTDYSPAWLGSSARILQASKPSRFLYRLRRPSTRISKCQSSQFSGSLDRNDSRAPLLTGWVSRLG